MKCSLRLDIPDHDSMIHCLGPQSVEVNERTVYSLACLSSHKYLHLHCCLKPPGKLRNLPVVTNLILF